MKVTDFIQASHNPSELIELCKGLRVERSKDKLNISKEIRMVNEMMQEKWHPPKIGLEELLELPLNSIGNNLGIYLIGMNKDQSGKHSIPGWMRFKLKYDQGYGSILATRVKQTHDFCHMLTNFNTTQMGEMAVQGFYLAQRAHALSLMFAYDILGSHLRGDTTQEYIDAFLEGMRIGMDAKEDITFMKFETMLDKDLDELRCELDIKTKKEQKPWRNYLGKLEPTYGITA